MQIVGFLVIPFKRKQAKENFKEKMTDLRVKLLESLTSQFSHEAEGTIARMKKVFLPIRAIYPPKRRELKRKKKF